jgi:hypothetical protein
VEFQDTSLVYIGKPCLKWKKIFKLDCCNFVI